MSRKVPFYRSRSLRTAFLAVTAAVTFVAAAILSFGVDWRVMLDFLLASLLGLGILIGAALLVSVVWVFLRRWLRK